MKQVVLEASSVLIIIFWEEIGIWTQNQVAVGPRGLLNTEFVRTRNVKKIITQHGIQWKMAMNEKSKFGIVLPIILMSYFMPVLDNSSIFTETAKIAQDLHLNATKFSINFRYDIDSTGPIMAIIIEIQSGHVRSIGMPMLLFRNRAGTNTQSINRCGNCQHDTRNCWYNIEGA
ncbi:hypothetical protein [Secundilactobacillus similis]|nr:hypothetical protein [Secundilactobacillus similis]